MDLSNGRLSAACRRPHWAHDDANGGRTAVLLQRRDAHRDADTRAVRLLGRDVEEVALAELGLAGLEDPIVALPVLVLLVVRDHHVDVLADGLLARPAEDARRRTVPFQDRAVVAGDDHGVTGPGYKLLDQGRRSLRLTHGFPPLPQMP